MTGKVFLVVALVCYIQVAKGSIITGITNDTLNQLAQVQSEVAEAQRQSSVEVNAIENLLEQYVNVGLKPLEKEVQSLNCQIKKTVKASQGTGVNLSPCASAARKNITQLDREQVRECILANDQNIGATLDPPPDLKPKEIIGAEQKLQEFTTLQNALSQAPNKCANKGILANNCVLAIINAAREIIMVLQNEISVILRHTDPGVEEDCITQRVQQLQDQIDGITNSWNACVKKQQSKHK